MSTFNQDAFLSEHERKKKEFMEKHKAERQETLESYLPADQEAAEADKELTLHEIFQRIGEERKARELSLDEVFQGVAEQKKAEEEGVEYTTYTDPSGKEHKMPVKPKTSARAGYSSALSRTEENILSNVANQDPSIHQALVDSDEDLEAIDIETWQRVLDESRKEVNTIIDKIDQELPEDFFTAKGLVRNTLGALGKGSMIAEKNWNKKQEAIAEANAHFGLSSVPLSSFLAAEKTTPEAIVDGIEEAIKQLEQPSNSLEESLATRRQAIENIAILATAAKVFPMREEMERLFPDIDWSDGDKAFVILGYKLQDSIMALEENYDKMTSPEYQWNAFLIGTSKQFINKDINSQDELFDFMEEVATDINFEKFTPKEVMHYAAQFKTLMDSRDNFIDSTQGSKEMIGQRDNQNSRDTLIEQGGEPLQISWSEHGQSHLFGRSSTFDRHLRAGDQAALAMYYSDRNKLTKHFKKSWLALVPRDQKTGKPKYEYTDDEINANLAKMLVTDSQGIITGTRDTDSLEEEGKSIYNNPLGYLAFTHAMIEWEKEEPIENGSPKTKKIGSDLVAYMRVGKDIKTATKEEARAFLTASWMLKELFLGKSGQQLARLQGLLGLNDKQATVLNTYAELVTNIFTGSETAYGKYTTAMQDDEMFSTYISSLSIDSSIVAKVGSMLDIMASPMPSISFPTTGTRFDREGEGDLFRIDIKNYKETYDANKNTIPKWAKELQNFFASYNVSFPVEDSEQDDKMFEELKILGILGPKDIYEDLRDSDWRLPYLLTLQTYMSADPRSRSKLSVILNAIKEMPGAGIVDILQIVRPEGKIFVDPADGAVIIGGADIPLDNTELLSYKPTKDKPSGIAIEVLQQSEAERNDDDGTFGSEHVTIRTYEVNRWKNNGVNIGRQAEGFWDTFAMSQAAAARGYAGEGARGDTVQMTDARQSWTKVKTDIDSMLSVAEMNFEAKDFAGWIQQLGINEDTWIEMATNSINKTFDPIYKRAREVIMTGKNSFAWNNRDSHISVLYWIMKDAEERNLNKGNIAWNGLKPENFKATKYAPDSEDIFKFGIDITLANTMNRGEVGLLALDGKPINWFIPEWKQKTKDIDVEFKHGADQESAREQERAELKKRLTDPEWADFQPSWIARKREAIQKIGEAEGFLDTYDASLRGFVNELLPTLKWEEDEPAPSMRLLPKSPLPPIANDAAEYLWSEVKDFFTPKPYSGVTEEVFGEPEIKTTPEATADTKESRIAPEVAEIIPEELEKKERAETATYISGYEGYIETPRTLPNENHRTVGIGHLLDGSKRSRASFKKAFPKKNYNEYKKGVGKLTQEEAQKLFQEDLPDYIKQAKKLTGDKFDGYSNNLRKNLISATYRGSWGQSPKARKLLTEGKFEEAATEFLNNDEYRNAVKLKRAGIRPRMEAVAKAIRDEAVSKEAVEVFSTVPADDPIHHVMPTGWEHARGTLGMSGVAYFVGKWILEEADKGAANEKIIDSVNKKFREGLHSYTDEESKWLLKKYKSFYKKQSKEALKALNKASRKPLIKSVGKLLGKVAGRIIPGGTIAMLIFGGASDAGDIAEKLTQDQMDVLERVKRDVEENGISQTEALIYHQLGAFARSPGTKF